MLPKLSSSTLQVDLALQCIFDGFLPFWCLWASQDWRLGQQCSGCPEAPSSCRPLLPPSLSARRCSLHCQYLLRPWRLLLPWWLHAFGLASLHLKDTPVRCALSLCICHCTPLGLISSTVGFARNRDIVALVQKKNMLNEPSTYVGTILPRRPPTNHKLQTREPWPYQADFGTTISNSFLGQISYLRRGNPLRASAPVTHRVCFASAACGCSFLWGLFMASAKLADLASGNQKWFLGPLHENSPAT